MTGFIGWMTMKREEEDLIMVRAKDDFIREESSSSEELSEGRGMEGWVVTESVGNWRPRKTWVDSQYIERNPESIVFFSDVREVVEVVDIESQEDLFNIVKIYLDLMGLIPKLDQAPLKDYISSYPDFPDNNIS